MDKKRRPAALLIGLFTHLTACARINACWAKQRRVYSRVVFAVAADVVNTCGAYRMWASNHSAVVCTSCWRFWALAPRPRGHACLAVRLHHASRRTSPSLRVGPCIPTPRCSDSLGCRCVDRKQVEREVQSRKSLSRWEGGRRKANLIKVNVILANAV